MPGMTISPVADGVLDREPEYRRRPSSFSVRPVNYSFPTPS
jgi:hypothetical protein